MKLNLSIDGLKPFQKKLLAKADPARIQKVIRINIAELTDTAQSKVPVSTGQLRKSIVASIEDDGMAGIVRTEAEYAEYVELGTRFMEAQPYMKPAFEEQKPKFLRDLKREISK